MRLLFLGPTQQLPSARVQPFSTGTQGTLKGRELPVSCAWPGLPAGPHFPPKSQFAQMQAHQHGASIEELAPPLAGCSWAWIALTVGSAGGKPPPEQGLPCPLKGSLPAGTTVPLPAPLAPQPWKAFHNPCPEQDD